MKEIKIVTRTHSPENSTRITPGFVETTINMGSNSHTSIGDRDPGQNIIYERLKIGRLGEFD